MKSIMKHKRMLFAIVMTIIMMATFTTQRAFASSPLRIVGIEMTRDFSEFKPTKVGNYYYKIDSNKNGDFCLFRSKSKNKGYKLIAKHIFEVWEYRVCAVNGKYCYVVTEIDGKSSIVRYPASGKGNKVVIDLPEGYWHLGAANGNSLYLQKGSKGIYRYNINNGKIKRIKANGTFARIPAQKGKYVMLWNEIKGGKYNHYLFRITDSGNLKKVKKLGTEKFPWWGRSALFRLSVCGEESILSAG